MLAAIAGEWLSAGGLNDKAVQAQFLADNTDDDLSAEGINGWALDQGDEENTSRMEFNDYTDADLSSAFKDLC